MAVIFIKISQKWPDFQNSSCYLNWCEIFRGVNKIKLEWLRKFAAEMIYSQCPKTERSVGPKRLITEQNRFQTGLEQALCLTNWTIVVGYQTRPKSDLFDNRTKPVLSEIRTFRFRTFTLWGKLAQEMNRDKKTDRQNYREKDR